jgi:hypothetical protein
VSEVALKIFYCRSATFFGQTKSYHQAQVTMYKKNIVNILLNVINNIIKQSLNKSGQALRFPGC